MRQRAVRLADGQSNFAPTAIAPRDNDRFAATGMKSVTDSHLTRLRAWKNASYDVSETPGFLAVTVEARLILDLRLERGDQVLIAAINGPTPKIVIIRFRL